MTVAVGDNLPGDIQLKEMVDGAPTDVKISDVFPAGKKVVAFAVPGAFTPTCSAKHLPGFVEQADAIKAKGVAEVVCISVNDAFVMGAWGDASNTGGKVRMLADGNGELTAALGLVLDGEGFGLGKRSKRYAMIVDGGKVSELMVDPGPGLTNSSAESVLEKL